MDPNTKGYDIQETACNLENWSAWKQKNDQAVPKDIRWVVLYTETPFGCNIKFYFYDASKLLRYREKSNKLINWNIYVNTRTTFFWFACHV